MFDFSHTNLVILYVVKLHYRLASISQFFSLYKVVKQTFFFLIYFGNHKNNSTCFSGISTLLPSWLVLSLVKIFRTFRGINTLLTQNLHSDDFLFPSFHGVLLKNFCRRPHPLLLGLSSSWWYLHCPLLCQSLVIPFPFISKFVSNSFFA